MRNKVFVVAAVLSAVVAFFVFKFYSAPPAETAAPEVTTSAESFVRAHSPTFGNTMSRVTVVQWFDPECESCRMVHPIFKKIVEQYKDKVHFVLRYMPYHQGSMYAASALEEARELGKFEQALDLIFEKQPEWGDHHAPKPELILTYLATLGIPADKLEREYVINKHGEKIKIDEADGMRVGVRGTPTFFVNGQMLRELGEQPLINAIEAALK